MTERDVYDGVHYSKFKWKESRCHVLRIDLRKRSVRAVPVGPMFPLWPYYENKPAELAKAAGAIASTNAGFPITTWHDLGVTSQPAGTLMIDREIWSTGLGHGGHAYLQANNKSWVQASRVEVRVWKNGKPLLLDSINRGHDGVNAFTWRGGNNELPSMDRYRMTLNRPGEWLKNEEGNFYRHYNVFALAAPGDLFAIVEKPQVVIESDEPFTDYAKGDDVRWVQDVGQPGVSNIVSGMTELVREGENAIPLLDLWGGDHEGPDAAYIRKNPRTGIGVSEDGRTAFIAVIEGRVQGSKGFRLKEFAYFLMSQGVYSASNLDGGGSSHMWIRGQKNNGLVADSCYGNGTLDGLRPNIYATSIF